MKRSKWLRRKHKCYPPRPSYKIAVASIWQCRCGQLWRLTENYQDPEGYHRWTYSSTSEVR